MQQKKQHRSEGHFYVENILVYSCSYQWEKKAVNRLASIFIKKLQNSFWKWPKLTANGMTRRTKERDMFILLPAIHELCSLQQSWSHLPLHLSTFSTKSSEMIGTMYVQITLNWSPINRPKRTWQKIRCKICKHFPFQLKKSPLNIM